MRPPLDAGSGAAFLSAITIRKHGF
jgi:hypothetical protein